MSLRLPAMLLSMLLFAVPLPAQQSIPFDVCAQSTTWVRPSPEVQAKIWNDPRYEGFARTAYDWTHNFLVVGEPASASLAYGLRNLSGLWTTRDSLSQCASGNKPISGYDWIAVWTLLHRVKEIRHEDNTYTITVELMGKGFQHVMFRRLNPSVVFQFVTPDGTELERWDESAPPNRVKK